MFIITLVIIVMGTRIEKNKRKRKEKRIKFARGILFILSCFLFILSIFAVDQSFNELMCLDNKRVLCFELVDKKIIFQIFGKDYKLDFSKIGNFK